MIPRLLAAVLFLSAWQPLPRFHRPSAGRWEVYHVHEQARDLTITVRHGARLSVRALAPGLWRERELEPGPRGWADLPGFVLALLDLTRDLPLAWVTVAEDRGEMRVSAVWQARDARLGGALRRIEVDLVAGRGCLIEKATVVDRLTVGGTDLAETIRVDCVRHGDHRTWERELQRLEAR